MSDNKNSTKDKLEEISMKFDQIDGLEDRIEFLQTNLTS